MRNRDNNTDNAPILQRMKKTFSGLRPLQQALIFLSFLALTTMLTVFLLWRGQTKTPSPREKLSPLMATQIFMEAAKQLKSRWEYGDLEGNFAKGKFQCPREIASNSSLDDQYLRCNPNYLQCFFDGKAGLTPTGFTVHLKDNQGRQRNFKVLPKRIYPAIPRYSHQRRFYTIVSRSQVEGAEVPSFGVMMTLEIQGWPEYSQTLVLEDSCHDSYLPQRTYAYALPALYEKNGLDLHINSDWIWDNFSRDIFIDKFLVTFRDIIEWVEYGKGPRNLKLPLDAKDWAQPATGLNLQEMRSYCAFRGKQLLEAHIFDAATFYPADLDNPRPPQVVRGPYPWSKSRKRRASLLTLPDGQEIPKSPSAENAQGPQRTRGGLTQKPEEMGEREETSESDQDRSDELRHQCQLTYVKECQSIMPLPLYSSNDTTWIEINQILGGHLEAFSNPLHPHKNLKASSFYFPADSLWHQLGLRAQWDGQNHGKSNIQWEFGLEDDSPTLPPEQEEDFYKIGFRCMMFSEGEI